MGIHKAMAIFVLFGSKFTAYMIELEENIWLKITIILEL